jgi:hypothetical protein
MGMFVGLKPGTWWIRSEKDPRWNADGKGQVGMFGRPAEAEAKVEELKKTLGDPPEDLEWGYMKD